MFREKLKGFGLIVGLSLTLFAAGCGANDNNEADKNAGTGSEEGAEIELAYVLWDTEIASTHVIGKVLEDEGYKVKLTPLDNAIMWSAVANGEADAMVAAWLPGTHGDLYEEYKDGLVNLGENLAGAKIGLVVPEYMDINSIEDLANYDEINTITAIEPGAGVVKASEAALVDYNLDAWEVSPSSSGAMATELTTAYNNEEPIIVTGWSPHWKFSAFDLKYLEDPKGTFGGEEIIATMAREGLKEDLPNAYQILDSFHWTEEDMNSVMLEISEGADPKVAAQNWIDANPDKVAEWVK